MSRVSTTFVPVGAHVVNLRTREKIDVDGAGEIGDPEESEVSSDAVLVWSSNV